MGIFYYCSKCGKRTDNENDNKLCTTCEVADFYFSVWCERLGYTQTTPWKPNNTTEVQDMQTAAELFIKEWDDQNNMALSHNLWTGEIIVYVQDWRGRIVKFELQEVKHKPIYSVRSIK